MLKVCLDLPSDIDASSLGCCSSRFYSSRAHGTLTLTRVSILLVEIPSLGHGDLERKSGLLLRALAVTISAT